MKKRILTFVFILAWLGVTAWFIRYEAFPEYFTRSLNGYQSLFSRGVLVRDSWMKILFKDSPVGYTHTEVETDENSVTRRYTMKNDVVLNLNLMGAPERIRTTAEASLDALHRLQIFKMDIDSRAVSTRITGTRRGGTRFIVTIRTDTGIKQRTAVEIPDDTIIYSPVLEMAVLKLKPGQHVAIKTLEPLSMSPATVIIRALKGETITVGGREVNAKVLSSDYMGMSTRSWMDDEGNVLRQELPLSGFFAEACSPDEAMAAGVSTPGEAEDILKAMAVKCTGTIASPDECTSLKLRFTGASLSSPAATTHRQRIVERKSDSNCVMTVLAERPFSPGENGPAATGDLSAFLSSTAFVQSDNPEIKARARKIVGSRTGGEAAVEIYKWVYENVAKVPSPGMPSALDVLKKMEGDCNEHTYLFTALARAAGMPARIKVGVVYTRGAFYYHAWPAVFAAGRWVEMDPTFGQEAVDATHIVLAEGELGEQISLITLIGHLEAEILETKYDRKDTGRQAP